MAAASLAACGDSAPEGGTAATAAPFTVTPVATLDEPWALAFLPDGRLLVSRNGGKLSALVAQSETTFVCPTCQWGQPYIFTRDSNGRATEVKEVQVSGAWIFKRTQ